MKACVWAASPIDSLLDFLKFPLMLLVFLKFVKHKLTSLSRYSSVESQVVLCALGALGCKETAVVLAGVGTTPPTPCHEGGGSAVSECNLHSFRAHSPTNTTPDLLAWLHLQALHVAQESCPCHMLGPGVQR